ncbi:uncharacterized protein LOC132611915 [Lycium barbarum]|uniref:uncharacterized protein LOC132611915 n=1 Tax=Lycium barbarum TaxID=112863 RepID=UPI00293EB5ED|nr:uncharacterized protein LOC132611915 [Lycium barbarum]
MGNKYCKKLHPIIAQAKGASNVWKKLEAVRDDVEHQIWWQLKGGTSSFWFDNWTKEGALYFVDNELVIDEEIKVREFTSDGEWNFPKLQEFLAEETVEYIQDTISPKLIQANNDKAWWMGETNGKFTVKSAWEETRLKQDSLEAYRYIWLKGLPIKISFFLWRVWKRCITTDDKLKRMHINIVSRCWCCQEHKQETMSHFFLTSPITFKLWKQFAFYVGFNIEGRHLQHIIILWWKANAPSKLQGIFQAMPAIIMWEIWKRRNSIKHGKHISYSRMVYQVQQTVHHLIRVKYPWFCRIPPDWPAVIDLLSNYKPKLHYCKVIWKMPQHGLKCNIDEASQGNPRISSYGFCIRNDRGNLVYAQAKQIGLTSNMMAETIAIQEAMKYCLGNNIQNVTLETDSLVLKNILQDVWKIPCQIVEKVEQIQQIMEQLQVQVLHKFREGNQLTGFLANAALEVENQLEFTSFESLPILGRKILNLDKAQIPSLSIKTRKIQPT